MTLGYISRNSFRSRELILLISNVSFIQFCVAYLRNVDRWEGSGIGNTQKERLRKQEQALTNCFYLGEAKNLAVRGHIWELSSNKVKGGQRQMRKKLEQKQDKCPILLPWVSLTVSRGIFARNKSRNKTKSSNLHKWDYMKYRFQSLDSMARERFVWHSW